MLSVVKYKKIVIITNNDVKSWREQPMSRREQVDTKSFLELL